MNKSKPFSKEEILSEIKYAEDGQPYHVGQHFYLRAIAKMMYNDRYGGKKK